MMALRELLAELFGDSPVFFRDNVLGCGTVNTVCLTCTKVIASNRPAHNHECAAHVREHHSPPPEPPTADHGGGTPPAGPDPSEDTTPPSEPEGSLGDSGGGELPHPDEPIPFRLSDAERENIGLRQRVAELETESIEWQAAWGSWASTKRQLERENIELRQRVADLESELEAKREHVVLLNYTIANLEKTTGQLWTDKERWKLKCIEQSELADRLAKACESFGVELAGIAEELGLEDAEGGAA